VDQLEDFLGRQVLGARIGIWLGTAVVLLGASRAVWLWYHLPVLVSSR
jgi:hypothetical protein